LRLPAARSPIDDLATGRFQRVIPDADVDPESVRRVVLCSGRVYYDLVHTRATRGLGDTAIVRVEQFYPWRAEVLQEALTGYDNASEYVWVQDEPENMGPWLFLQPRLQKLFGHERVRVACRAASASPATGSGKAHGIEQSKLMRSVFGDSEAE
ncbi:MAG: 2-oxoglutarate dehydrogenase E1 component, partial [Deltaproteobacteria bacterium]|nr:2-oxoglutarate dehydrogenase E1 component [Deltaproteobacteria bacterium]